MNKLNLYYQHKGNNFGDVLNYNIFNDLFFTKINPSRPYQADAIGMGSILEKIFYNTNKSIIYRKNLKRKICSITNKKPIKILGSGFINDIRENYSSLKLFRPIKIIGIRGKKSLEIIRNVTDVIDDDIFIGDPGLLISDLNINLNVRKRFDIGIIPHETDKRIKNILSHFKNTNICLLDPNDHPLKFIGKMLTCETIASSSLHGLIASDSLNIPNIWIKLSNNIIGNDFKFNDYYSIYGLRNSCIDLTKKHPSLITNKFIKSRYEVDSQLVEIHKKNIKNHLKKLFDGNSD